jgi:hypothetical protein
VPCKCSERVGKANYDRGIAIGAWPFILDIEVWLRPICHRLRSPLSHGSDKK